VGDGDDGGAVEAAATAATDTRRRVVKKINTHMCRVRTLILIIV